MTPPLGPALAERPVRAATSDALLEGDLYAPDDPKGLVVYAHGAGSSRHSPRDRRVAQFFAAEGLATLVFDLLTRSEDAQDRWTYRYRFNIPLLSRRLGAALDWARRAPPGRRARIGLFGAGADATATLRVAADRSREVSAVGLLGGKLDLSRETLHRVSAPTLLLAGEKDDAALHRDRLALAALKGPREMCVVPGAGHLFTEPEALETAARRAAGWFVRYLGGSVGPASPVVHRHTL